MPPALFVDLPALARSFAGLSGKYLRSPKWFSPSRKVIRVVFLEEKRLHEHLLEREEEEVGNMSHEKCVSGEEERRQRK